MTSSSERALTIEEFAHRIVVFYEMAGLESDFASMIVRTLLSEGRIAYDAVEKTPFGLRGKRIVKEGPTGMLSTTTRIKIHPENETGCCLYLQTIPASKPSEFC